MQPRTSASTPRPPALFNSIVPVCYRKDDGRTRLVRPWNVVDQSTPTCRPPVPWDQTGVPANGWSSRLCTTGGSFDCDDNEHYTQLQDSIAGPVGPMGPQGPTGATGAQGAAGAQGERGQAGPKGDGFTFRGAWDPAIEYRENDVVTENGSAYVALRKSTGEDPAQPGNAWAIFVERGEQGEPGPPGADGRPGADGSPGIGAIVTPIPPVPVGTGPCGLEGGALVRDGSGNIVAICNGKSGTTGQGAGMALSNNFIFPTTTTANVPDLALNVVVTDANAGVMVSTDGGVQVNSVVVGQFVIVDIFLFVDSAATPTAPETSKLIARRRIFAANSVTQQAVTNWSMSVVDVEPPGGPYVYRVAAQLVANNGSNAIVSGSSTTVPWLRGTLTAVVINK